MKNQKNKNLIFKIIPLVILTLFTFGNLSQNVSALNCNELEHSYYGCNPNEECISNTIWTDDTSCPMIVPSWVCCIPKSLENDPEVKEYLKKLEESQGFIIKNPLGDTYDISTLVMNILDFLIKLAIPLTAILVVYAGLVYITSAGNEEKVKTAQKVLIWALIGFAVVLIARSIPQLIIDFLQGS